MQWTVHVRQPQSARVPERAASRADRSDSAEVVRLPDHGRQRVVGEHFYQAVFQHICQGKRVPRAGDAGCWENSLPVTARLVAEHDNPYDQTAVRVDVQYATVGHLPRDDAVKLHRSLTVVQSAGKHAECEGRIVIAGNGDYSIYLHLADLGLVASVLQPQDNKAPMDSPWQADASGEGSHQNVTVMDTSVIRFSAAELEDARMTYQTNYNHRTMNCGRGSAEITTIVGTSRFQDSLREAVATPRPWRHQLDRHLPALVARDLSDPTIVAVLIDGNIVGYLDREVAGRHREQLQELERAGQHLVCSALIVGGGGGKSFGVRLQIKPDIGRRWAAGAKPSQLSTLQPTTRGRCNMLTLTFT